jgi:hypothetical protein
MSAPKHTPGPWTVGVAGRYGTDNANIIYSQGGEGSVATVYGLPMNTKLEDIDSRYGQGLANARLIAAAPETAAERDRLREVNAELLLELENALIIFKFGEDDKTVLAPKWVARAEAAIAKATRSAS